MILTVVVSYRRLRLLKQTLRSYEETVTGDHHLIVVDNHSDYRTRRWLRESGHDVIFLPENRYPGYATNFGWTAGLLRHNATLLHRSDNDGVYLPGWADHVRDRFAADPYLGQLGLRTVEEEGAVGAVGGFAVLRRALWDNGLRYSELPWTECSFEDGVLSHQVEGSGWRWERVTQRCCEHAGICSSKDPYYKETFGVRGIGFPGWAS